MTGVPFLIFFIASIAAMIFLISKCKLHPFLSMLLVSLVLGLVGGIPLVDITDAAGNTVSGIATVIGKGFSSTFTSIGIVIILGALIGSLLEETGAALKLADIVVRLVGSKRPELAIELMGWVVSIPVFCDSGFVVLNPIRKALVKKTGVSSVTMTVCLAAGLNISHVFIPPTPGPLAAAGNLGVGSNMLLVMGLGTVVSIPALIGAFFFAKYIGKRVKSADESDKEKTVQTYEELVASFKKLPGAGISLAPILLPILLMAFSGIASGFSAKGTFYSVMTFLGTPIVALAIGVVPGIIGLFQAGRGDRLYSICDETLKTVGPILFVTAAGGVLGQVISSTSLISFITERSGVLKSVGIVFPFLLSIVLRIAQGSSTVALTTVSSIIAPMMPALGMDSPVRRVLCVMAIAAGSLIVSHANDSYFWVVTNFGEMTPAQGYKTQTIVTLVEGVCAMAAVFVLSLIFR